MAEDNDVILIGAGMAGLTAARALAESGRRVLVIEARDRIGGRIWTRHIGDEAIELGAEFIHGRPPELWALIEEAGLQTYEREGAQACFQDGKLNDCGGEMEEVFEPLEKLEKWDGPDLTFVQYLDREQVPPDQRGPMIGYVEGFNAADAREVSAASLGVQQKAEDAIDGGHNYRLRGGYDHLPAYLAQRIAACGGRVLKKSPVTEIRWRPGGAEVITRSGTFKSAQVVVTLPLSILQSGDVAISPQPDSVVEAWRRLRMGQARRFTLLFRERFWEHLPPQAALNQLGFLFAFAEMPPVWWTSHPEPGHTLTGWVGGPRSSALAGLNEEQLATRACSTLAKIFNITEDEVHGQLQSCHSHDWRSDPFARGSYSYVAAGGLDASRQMAEPVANTLFFAGEHTDITGHWGTVHAAMRSGLRAAEQILSGAPQR